MKIAKYLCWYVIEKPPKMYWAGVQTEFTQEISLAIKFTQLKDAKKVLEYLKETKE